MHRLVKIVIAGMVGSVLMLSPVQAASFTINVPANPPAPGVGSWQVVLNTTDFVNWSQTTTANGGAQTPDFAASDISITFWKAMPFVAGNVINSVSGSAVTTGSPVGGGPWTASAVGANAEWQRSPVGVFLPTNGLESVSGTWSVENDQAKFVNISIQGDGGSQWTIVGAALVPEPTTMALAAAGLVPLAGAWLKRRRRNSEVEETEEVETVT